MNMLQILVLGIIYVLGSHYIADFLCQTRQMANNKSKSVKWLTIHVVTYTIVLYLLCLIPFYKYGFDLLKWVLLNGAIHWFIDFHTSKFTSYFYEKKNEKAFFSVVGFDQFLHGASLFGTLLLF